MEIKKYNSRISIISSKYHRLQSRLQKAMKAGRFSQFTTRKQQQLLRLLSRYEGQLKRLGYACVLSAPILLVPATTDAQVTVGSEFQVHTYTSSLQNNPSVAMDSDGDFVVAWISRHDGNNNGIFAQRYDNTGTAAGPEFQVNTETASSQSEPSVAMDSDGDFVIAWHSLSQDGDHYGIFAQRYDNTGTAAGSEFQVNTHTASAQKNASVAMDSDGDFVIAWDSYGQDGNHYGIYAQRYDNVGTAAGPEFPVNTHTTNKQQYPSVGMDSDGDFVIAWNSASQDGQFNGVFAQRYDNTGTAAGSEFQVNTHTSSNQNYPSVALDSDGDFVISWYSDNQDGNGFGVYAQRYNNAGTAVGSEFLVNTHTNANQNYPVVGIDSDGDFAIAWISNGQDGSSSGVYAQRYDNAGTKVSSEFQVNTYTTSIQQFPAIAMDSDGDFVVAWYSDGQDGSSTGVYAQRYSSAAPPPFSCGPNAALPTTAGTLVGATATLDADGFTYFCDANEKLLLAVKIPAGWTIPADAIQLKIGATKVNFFSQYCGATGSDRCFVQNANGTPIVNRYWEVDESKITAGSNAFFEIKHFFTNDEYNAINTELTNQSLTNLSAVTDVQLYNTNVYQVSSMFPAVGDVKPVFGALIAKNGATPGATIWVHSTHGVSDHAATFKLHSNLFKAGGGLGGKIK